MESVRLDLLDVLGRGYVVEHCIAAFNSMQEERLYRIYVTDSLKALIKADKRYYDFIDRKPVKKRTYDEIMDEVWGKILKE